MFTKNEITNIESFFGWRMLFLKSCWISSRNNGNNVFYELHNFSNYLVMATLLHVNILKIVLNSVFFYVPVISVYLINYRIIAYLYVMNVFFAK